MEGSHSRSEVLEVENKIPDLFAEFRTRADRLGMDARAADLCEEFFARIYKRAEENCARS